MHAGTLRSQFGETSEALFLTQGYVYDTAAQAEARFKDEEPGYHYSRFSNPTVAMFEERMAAFEGAEAARATATGMAAVTAALMGQVKAGDHVVAAKALFGSCRYVVEDFLPRYGVASTLVDGTDLDAMAQRRAAEHQDVLPREPDQSRRSKCIDIAAVAKIAHAAGATLVVDNVFATPLWQSPLELGADCVVYSATKHIDGQGRCLGGVILASEKFIQDNVHQSDPPDRPVDVAVQRLGAAEGPGDAAACACARQTETAATVADRAGRSPEDHAADLSGPAGPSAGRDRAEADARRLDAGRVRGRGRQGRRIPLSQDALKLVRISNNLGDAKSLITHPATTTHQRLSAGSARRTRHQDGLVRLSCGLEHPDDVVEDLLAALDKV